MVHKLRLIRALFEQGRLYPPECWKSRAVFGFAERGLGVTRLAVSPEGDRFAVAGVRSVADLGGKESS